MTDEERCLIEKSDAFIAEIRSSPAFVAAASTDPVWLEHLAGIENGIETVNRRADEDPKMIEAYDEIQLIIGSRDRTLKQRLLAIVHIFGRLRAAGRIIH